MQAAPISSTQVGSMKLQDALPDAQAILDMAPEALAGHLVGPIRKEMAGNNGKLNRQSFLIGVTQDFGNKGGEVALAVATAWQYLVISGVMVEDPTQLNAWYVFTARGRAVESAEDFRRADAIRLYPKALLNPYIVQKTFDEFVAGDYESAVFKAFKAVEVAVRQIGEFSDADYGLPLIAKAFNPDNGPLTLRDEQPAEREAVRNLFCGAYGLYRNPAGHRIVSYNSPARALEVIGLASLLMRRLEDVQDALREYQ